MRGRAFATGSPGIVIVYELSADIDLIDWFTWRSPIDFYSAPQRFRQCASFRLRLWIRLLLGRSGVIRYIVSSDSKFFSDGVQCHPTFPHLLHRFISFYPLFFLRLALWLWFWPGFGIVCVRINCSFSYAKDLGYPARG